MKANNTMSKIEFGISHVFWALIAMIWYRIIFRCVDGYSLTQSRVLLWSMLAICCILGVTLNLKKRRNYISIFMDLAICFGLYTVLSYQHIIHQMISITAVITVAVIIVFGLIVLMRKIRNREHFFSILWKRLERVTVGAQFCASCGLMVIILSLSVSALFGQAVLQATAAPANSESIEEYTIDRQMDILVQLHEDNWKELTVQERLNVLQVVANIEQRYLGSSTELNVGADNLSETLYGYYDDETHSIVININLLLSESPWVVLDTVCHESYHSYQYRVVDLYNEMDEEAKKLMIFDDVRQYKEEFANYADGEENFEQYYVQKCESTAREYAKEAVVEYYTRITEYIENQ